MQFRELILKNFGKFNDKKIMLSDGINLIYGENEAGKSTIHTFLRGMLFGMERGRGRAALNDRFSRYEPWENPNYYAGVLRFCSGERMFCLSRQFDKYSKTASLFCEDDGEEFSLEHGDLEVLMGGLSEVDYENTIAIAQNKVLVGKELASEIKNFAANYCVTGDSDLNLEVTFQNLKERKKELEQEIAARERAWHGKKDAVELEMSYVWRENYHLEQECTRVQELKKEYQDELKCLQVQMNAAESGNRFEGWRIHPIAIIVMVLTMVLTIMVFERPWNMLLAIVLLLAEAIFTWNNLKGGKAKKKIKVSLSEKIEALRDRMDKNDWHLEQILEDLEEKKIQYRNLSEYLEELEEDGRPTEEQIQRRKALKLAEERIREITSELRTSIGRKLNETMSEIFCEITDGKYTKVWVDEQLQISLAHEGRIVDMNQVSRGTLEQLHFALRMAAVRILYEEEYPVILDDAFAYYDDERMGQTLKWLSEHAGQVIVFTCQKREEEILKKHHIKYHKIEL